MARQLYTVLGTLAVIAAFAVLILLMGAMRPKVAKVEAPTISPAVMVMRAEVRPVRLKVTTQGEVRARTDIPLTAQVAGRIVKVGSAFVDGGRFLKGDLLVKIEDADYRAAIAGARARLAQAAQTLKFEQAEAALAARDFQELGQEGAASDLVLRKPQLAQARANYDAANADLKTAQLNLERTEITAPFDGRVRSRAAGEGQFVSPGTQLAQVFATDVAEVRLPLADRDLARLGLPIGFVESEEKKGLPVVLRASVSGFTHNWRGRLARISADLDPATRQAAAIAIVEDPYGAGADNGIPLPVGLFVTAEIDGRALDRAIVAPSSALVGLSKVFVLSDANELVLRDVVVAAADSDTATLISGVEPGERIVVAPPRNAKAGDVVTPAETNSILGDGSRPSLSAASGG
ncbi:MAG: efflux RND transporter periplasmic adaptor subunit [Pseudomonadota bacterium]